MARHRHDRAGAVIHQHEIRDIDRQVGAGERVLRGDAGVEAQLFGGFEFGSGGAALLAQRDEFARRIAVHRLRNRMVRRDRDEACAENRVRTRGVDRQFFAV